MMRSLYSGVSGLQNHQTRMDVIGNNISNVNTHGFKTSRATFQDMLSQTISGASRPEQTRGGINPRQVGLGMNIAAIDKIFTQGSLETTGNPTDLALTGDGFFIVAEGDNNFYTRAGAFGLDRDGTMVNPANGMKVQGWMARPDATGNMVIDSTGTIEDLIIPIYSKIEARETTDVRYQSNLDSRSPVVPDGATAGMRASAGVTTNIDIYDNQGNNHRMSMIFWKTGVNTWSASAAIAGSEGPVTLDVPAGAGQENQPNPNSRINLQFSPDGKLLSIADDATPDQLNSGVLTVDVNFRIPGDPNVRNVTLNLGSAGVEDGITQFASHSTTKAVEQNGYGMGYMESYDIDNSGIITGIYSNGTRRSIGQVATAVFTNPQGLQASGNTMFEVSNNSGMPNIGPAAQEGRGNITAGALEMSNVDLADQFTNMIVTQRGFQANSRSITTSDEMLQELLTLKR